MTRNPTEDLLIGKRKLNQPNNKVTLRPHKGDSSWVKIQAKFYPSLKVGPMFNVAICLASRVIQILMLKGERD